PSGHIPPPRFPWPLVLILHIVTFGLFGIVWMIRQSRWATFQPVAANHRQKYWWPRPGLVAGYGQRHGRRVGADRCRWSDLRQRTAFESLCGGGSHGETVVEIRSSSALGPGYQRFVFR